MPGTARVSLNAILTAEGFDPIPFDIWINSYSPSNDMTGNLSSGFNNTGILANPDTTNCRLFIFIPPRGNATTITLKGVTGDTGLAQHPNGVILLTLPATSAPSAIGITTGGTINGCRVIWA